MSITKTREVFSLPNVHYTKKYLRNVKYRRSFAEVSKYKLLQHGAKVIVFIWEHYQHGAMNNMLQKKAHERCAFMVEMIAEPVISS